MIDNLDRIIPKIKTGQEPFHIGGKNLGHDLSSFWAWSISDLISNATRGRLAEFIVALALQIPVDGVRDEWSAYDLKTDDGIKVEVKSAAYIQSWYQRKLSLIQFRVPKTLAWNSITNRQATEAKRQADVYVFALLKHEDKSTIDPLDVSQWEFYVVPTSFLDNRTRSQYSITLATLQKEKNIKAFTFERLDDAVRAAFEEGKSLCDDK